MNLLTCSIFRAKFEALSPAKKTQWAGIKADWVALLRSGDFVQGFGHLQEIDSNGQERFCCLGVLCQLVQVPAGLHREKIGHITRYNGDMATPPEAVTEFLGFNPNLYVTIRDKKEPLSYLNDLGASFTEIATAIEEQL